MSNDVFRKYKKKLASKKKRKPKPPNRKLEEQKQLFASGDKFWRLFQDCIEEIRANKTAKREHFDLRVQNLLESVKNNEYPEAEQQLNFVVKEHLDLCLKDDHHPIGKARSKFTNIFHATYALTKDQLKRTSKFEQLRRKKHADPTSPSLSIGISFSSQRVSSSGHLAKEAHSHIKKHRNAVLDVQKAIERILKLLILMYPLLGDKSLYYVAEQAVHCVIFPTLEPTLFDLYRLRLRDSELMFATNSKNMRHFPLTSFGVSEKFILRRCVAPKTEGEASRENSPEPEFHMRRTTCITEIVKPPTFMNANHLSQDLSGFENQNDQMESDSDYLFSRRLEQFQKFSPPFKGRIPFSYEENRPPNNFLGAEPWSLAYYGQKRRAFTTDESNLRKSKLEKKEDKPHYEDVMHKLSRLSFVKEEDELFAEDLSFTKSDYSSEMETARSRKSTLTASLAARSVQSSILTVDEAASPTTTDQQINDICRLAYEPAYSLLHKLQEKYCITPHDKLQIVINLANEICNCVDRNYEELNPSQGKEPEKIQIDTDALIVLFAYMMIQSNYARVLTELEFVEDFVSHRIRNGMDEYYLSTMRAAAKLISSTSASLLLTEVDTSIDPSRSIDPHKTF